MRFIVLMGFVFTIIGMIIGYITNRHEKIVWSLLYGFLFSCLYVVLLFVMCLIGFVLFSPEPFFKF